MKKRDCSSKSLKSWIKYPKGFVFRRSILTFLRVSLLALFTASCANNLFDDFDSTGRSTTEQVYITPISAYIFGEVMPSQFATKCTSTALDCEIAKVKSVLEASSFAIGNYEDIPVDDNPVLLRLQNGSQVPRKVEVFKGDWDGQHVIGSPPDPNSPVFITPIMQ